MKIVCLGWGSLIWKPERLSVKGEWYKDGVLLPIEFTRVSKDGRVTLIIDDQAEDVITLWNPMTITNLDDAIENLREREGTISSKIHFATLESSDRNPFQKRIIDWLKLHEMDAAIWTGLSYSQFTQFARPTIEQIISHLSTLKDKSLKDAREYIVNAPTQIETEYRLEIMNRLNW